MKSELEEKIMIVLNQNTVGVLASVRDEYPHARYMTFINDGFTLYTSTGITQPKTEEITTNPRVCILIGYRGNHEPFVEINGHVEIEQDEFVKEKLYVKTDKSWLTGDNNPDFIVIKIIPEQIRLLHPTGEEPEVMDMK